MRLNPFRRVAAAAPIQRAPVELGASGTVNSDGFLVQDEYNQNLTGRRAIRTYDQMRRSDASVREALQHIMAPIKNANWDIEPHSDDPEDLAIAAAVRCAYFKWPPQPFIEYLSQALHYLTFGHQVFELAWQVVDDEVSYEDPDTGDQVDIPRRQYLTFRRFAQRLQSTIYKWNIENGELVSIVQQVWSGRNFTEVEIPADSLLVFVNELEGDDFNGISVLRSAYKAWVMKELTEKTAGIAIERHGVGVPVVYPSRERANDDAHLDRLEQMLLNLRSGQFNYMVFPEPKAQGAQDGMTFEIVSPPGGVPDFTPLLEYQRGEIKGNVLARFSELGHGSTGARATGDVQSEVWRAALHAVARHIADVNDIAIARFVQANFGIERYPKLVANDIEKRNLTEFADANMKLVSSGAIVPDPSYLAYVRKSIDAPDPDEGQPPPDQPQVEQDVQPQDQQQQPPPQQDKGASPG